MYAGDWRNGKLHGTGKMKYTNGDEYDGEWENDAEHGKGTFKSLSGDILVGEWENGVKNGEFTLKSTNGEFFKQIYDQGELVSNRQCISDVAPIHGLLSSPYSCANATVEVIVLDEHDTMCPVCCKKFLPDIDAKKPVIGLCLCNYVVCHECVLNTARSQMNGGVVPALIDCMGCRAKDAFSPAAPLYDRRLIDWLHRSIPVLRKTDLGYVSD
jgi:hypothetical protein